MIDLTKPALSPEEITKIMRVIENKGFRATVFVIFKENSFEVICHSKNDLDKVSIEKWSAILAAGISKHPPVFIEDLVDKNTVN